MSTFDVLDVIASGLSAARQRVNVIASNIANAETTRTAEGGPYKRRDVVQVATSMPGSFSSVLDRVSMAKPSIAAVVEDSTPGRTVYQPGHPDANPDGYVEYPNVNIVSSMTDMTTASRLYQANAVALETARRISQDARDLGRS